MYIDQTHSTFFEAIQAVGQKSHYALVAKLGLLLMEFVILNFESTKMKKHTLCHHEHYGQKLMCLVVFDISKTFWLQGDGGQANTIHINAHIPRIFRATSLLAWT